MARQNTPSKRIGRPTTPGKAGEKSAIGVRVSPALKARLIWAAKESGRSLSQEAELRLERSFETESMHHHIDDVIQHHIDEVNKSIFAVQRQNEEILKSQRSELLLSRWLHLEFLLGPETIKKFTGGKTVGVEDEDALQALEAFLETKSIVEDDALKALEVFREAESTVESLKIARRKPTGRTVAPSGKRNEREQTDGDS